jgi:hypothetical protein
VSITQFFLTLFVSLSLSPKSPKTCINILDSINETCAVTFGGVSVRYAYLSQRGYYPDGEILNTRLHSSLFDF